MKDVLPEVDSWTARGDRVAVATVVAVKRSAPRPPGAKMAINDHGDVTGAVSGGCVEGAVVVAAEDVIRTGEPVLQHFGIADEEAWDVGLPCGGEISVWTQAEPHAGFAELARDDGRGALVTVIGGAARPGARMLVRADGAVEGSLGDATLDGEAIAAAEELMWAERSETRTVVAGGAAAAGGGAAAGDGVSAETPDPAAVTIFVDVTHPAPRLIAVGAVDFARQLCHVARAAGWRPFVVDPRSRFATRERFPEAEEVVAAWPQDAFRRLGIDRATAIAVLTHDPKLDDAALTAALDSEAGYIGAMGSRRAQARRRERLLAAGVAEEALERIAAPIGLDLGALTAEETALSIMGEIVAVRHGRAGGRLRDAGGRIHEVGS